MARFTTAASEKRQQRAIGLLRLRLETLRSVFFKKLETSESTGSTGTMEVLFLAPVIRALVLAAKAMTRKYVQLHASLV